MTHTKACQNKSDYQIETILSGKASDKIRERAANGRFDERIALIGLLMDAISEACRQTAEQEDYLVLVLQALKHYRASSTDSPLKNESDRLRETLFLRSRAGTLSQSERRTLQLAIGFFQTCMQNGLEFDGCKKAYRKDASQLQEQSRETSEKLSNAFAFIEEVFPQGQEMLIFVTELTVNEITSRFISHYGCEPYYLHSKDLMFYERNKEIASRMAALEL